MPPFPLLADKQTNKQWFLCSVSDSQLQVWGVSITVSRYWRISYRPPPRLENKLWEQTHAKARGNAAALHQEQQPGLLPCGGSGQHHTDQPNGGGGDQVRWFSKADHLKCSSWSLGCARSPHVKALPWPLEIKHKPKDYLQPWSTPRPSISQVTHLKHAESALVAHAHQTAQGQLQDHGAFKWDKVPHVLKQEELWSVVIAVTARQKGKNYP